MNSDRLRQLLVVVGIVFALALNGAANALPINGQTTAEISDRFRVFVVPAGYVFAIWGLIYLGQLGFLFQALRPSGLEDPLLRRIGLWPALVGLLNGIWILLWHYEVFAATVVVMVALLGSLIVLYRRAGFERTARPGSGVSAADRWLVQVPFSLYLGWITVATIANVAAVGNWAGVSTFGAAPELLAAVVLGVGLAIASWVMLRTADVTYAGVIIWAHAGIIVKEASTPWVPWIAGLTVAVMVVLILAAFARRNPLTLRPVD
ncbi:MAG TPA: hypothetical protein VJK49_05040 [Candidatus Limnocylindrales bacterium]|nr:hypothetical protein [Candidatus Limnocylindrales bacterium]